ncbi:MAG: DUF2442 domain-containing protein [Desulfobacterium sp.]|jgi:hypothetical protein|nr:DUF2442 domain-containing protein [Desulfobacterium sp.]
MKHPRIKSARAIDSHTLLVEFDNSQKKKYDIRPLLNKEMFSLLKNQAFFKAVQVDAGGYAVVWNSDIDISEHELWTHGEDL